MPEDTDPATRFRGATYNGYDEDSIERT